MQAFIQGFLPIYLPKNTMYTGPAFVENEQNSLFSAL